MGKEKKISREDIAKMSREEQMKYEIAQELGLLDQVLEEGWKRDRKNRWDHEPETKAERKRRRGQSWKRAVNA